jgi:hypothetical protein
VAITQFSSKKAVSRTCDRVGKYIYTDSEEEMGRRSDPSSSVVRTKAAVKAFSPVTTSRGRGKKASEPKTAIKSTTELIVPQRQAAKKATESLHSANANVSTKERKEDKDTKGLGKENVVLPQQSKSDVKGSTETANLTSEETVEKTKGENKSSKEKDKKASSISTEKIAASSDFPSYVPQRQAARKAAETIKIGSCKSSVSLFDIESELSGDSSMKKKLKTDSKMLTATITKGKLESRTKSKIDRLFDSTDSDSGDAKEDHELTNKKKGKIGADAETTQVAGKPFRDRGPRPSESESHSTRGGVASSGQSSSAGRGAQKNTRQKFIISKNFRGGYIGKEKWVNQK